MLGELVNFEISGSQFRWHRTPGCDGLRPMSHGVNHLELCPHHMQTGIERMTTRKSNSKVDAYVAKAQPFAQPIMKHLRDLVHKGCPEAEEAIKWSRPFFVYRGAILCNMAAFKQHCSFGFWGVEIGAVLREAKVLRKGAMGSLGRIQSVKHLPSDKLMLGWIRQAAAFVDSGQYTSPIAARRRVVKA